MKVIAYLHTHWDREWYQPFEEFRLRFIEVFDKIINELNQNKIQQFYLDGQTVALEDYLEIFPEKKEQIINLIKNKRIIVGPWYALADEFLVSGESLIRNLLIGTNQAKDFGCDDFIGYLPDAFGHCEAMPLIFKSFGIETALLWRGAGEKQTTFNWESKDGSGIRTIHLPQGYFQDIFTQDWTYSQKAKALTKILDKIAGAANNEVLLIPIGADHLATPDELNDQLDKINKNLKNYKIEQGSLTDYAQSLKALNIKTYQGELRDNSKSDILSSVFSTRMYLKQQNARSQWLLTKLAEPLQSICELASITPSRKSQLNYAWKNLLKNHAHDSICGCSVDPVHQEMEVRTQKIDQVTNGIIDRCLRDVSKNIKEGDIAVFNASSYPFTGMISLKTSDKLPQKLQKQLISTNKAFAKDLLYDIQRIPVTEDYLPQKEYLIKVENLKPNSISVISKNQKLEKSLQQLSITEDEIKNENIQAKIKKDGSLEITNLKTGSKFTGAHIFEDIADNGDTYNFAPLKNDTPIKSKFIGSKIIEKGPLRVLLRLTYSIKIPADISKNSRSKMLLNHIITTDMMLAENADFVEFQTTWQNKAKNHLLQVRFELKEKITKLICEDHFGLIERKFDPDYKMADYTPAPKKTELKTNTAPIQRFVWAQGFGLITEGLSECEVEKNKLKLTLLRSTGIISNPINASRGTPAGPPLTTPDAQCLRPLVQRYAVFVCENPVELFKQAEVFMGCTLTTQGISDITTIPNVFIDTNNENICTIAIKTSENNSKAVVIRLLNLTDKSQNLNIRTNLPIKEIFEINSLEQKISKINHLNKNIEFNPYELKSFWLE